MPVAALLVALLAWGGAAPAWAQGLPPAVDGALRAGGIARHQAAILVQEVGSPRPRLSLNARVPMNPASVMKLVTTYAALELLGPAYTWKTQALALSAPEDGVLRGDLWLRGGGDPALAFERFWLLLRALRAGGVAEIRGDLVLDRSLFAPEATTPFDANALRAYNVAPDALLLNFGALRFDFAPRPAIGSVEPRVEPQPDGLTVSNRLRLSDAPCGEWKDDIRIERSRTAAGAIEVVLSGPYPAACGEKSWNLAVLDTPQLVFGLFRGLWRELGGRFSGKLREAPVPEGARLLAETESPPLAQIVRDINKWSNNAMARQLYLTLGAEAGARPARETDAEAAVRAFLAHRKLDFPELVMENGAGLSRRARLSAASTARLLQSAWSSARMPEFIASLPLVATDGTMRKRLAGNGAAGQGHLKTGSLEGVKTLAGYVLGRSGRRWIVVFFIRHPDGAAARAAQDALIEWVQRQ
ncbi:MAG: D-alanyl-D-alanine carboxypeptidase/D-alanyl-D-alanine-endopeptidase [Rhodocyclaceae bacterium]